MCSPSLQARATEHAIYPSGERRGRMPARPPTTRCLHDLARTDLGDVRAHRLAKREVALVCRQVHRIEVDGREDVEPCLLEAEGHPASATEQLDGGQPPVLVS